MSLMRSKGSEFYPLVFVFIICVGVLYLFGLDRFGLFDVDEAIFAQASREMLQNNDWVSITYNGALRSHKPALIYWLQALSMQEWGIGPWAARLPSAIFGLLTVFSFFVFVERLSHNVRYALIAAAVLGLNLSFLVVTQAATADMALNFFSLTVTFALLANMFAKERSNVTLLVAGLLLGAGLLAKGPVVLMVPAVVVFTVMLFRIHQLGYLLKAANPFWVGFAALVVVAPWVFMMYQAHGMEFFNEFIFKHNLARFSEGFGNTQSSSPLYYLWVVLLGFFPWSLLIPGALFWIMPDFIHRLRSDKAAEALPALGLVWFLAVTLFFSFSATKLPHYIVPGFAGAALFVAGRLEAVGKNPLVSLNMVWTVPVIMLFSGVFLLLKWVPEAVQNQGWLAELLAWAAPRFNFEWPITDPETVGILSQPIAISIFPFMAGTVLLITMLSGLTLLTKGHKGGIGMWGAGMLIALMLIKLEVVPTIYKFQQGPTEFVAEQLVANHTEGDKVFYLSFHHPSVRFLSNIPFTTADKPEEVVAGIKYTATTFVATESRYADAVIAQLPVGTSVSKNCRAGYCLVTIAPKQAPNPTRK